MKKLFILLVCSACWALACAQTYVWDNGKIELAMSACGFRFTKVPADNFSTLGKVTEMNNYLYNLMGMDKSYRNRLVGAYCGLNTDIEIGRGSRDEYIYNVGTGTGNLSTTNGRDPWTYLAKMVDNSSAIIDGIKQHCDTTKPAFAYCLGEAIFLRAFALSEMVKLWGDVPSSWKMYGGFIVPMNPKQDRNQIYEAIRSDLRRASNLLPWSEQIPSFNHSSLYREPTGEYPLEDTYMEHPSSFYNYTGAPSKAAALALLARVDLNYAGYAMKPNNLGVPSDGYCIQLNVVDSEKRRSLYHEALVSCAQVIAKEGDMKLLPSFEDVFKRICSDVTDYTRSEVIWEIPFANAARGQMLCLNGLRIDTNVPGHLVNTISYGSSSTSNTKVQSMVRIVPTFYLDFEEGDTRRDVTVAPFRWQYNDGSSVYRESAFPDDAASDRKLYQEVQRADNLSLGKYRVEWMARPYSSNEDGVNAPIIRMADVLLMFCEASLGGVTGDVPENNTGLSAQTQFDRIRARAGLSPKTLNMDNLMKERAFEFCGEYLRKYDLMRWGLLRTKLVNEASRLENLANGTGEFAGRMDSIYFKYKHSYSTDAEYAQDASHVYVLDSVVGWRLGDVPPAAFDPENGWVRKALYTDDNWPSRNVLSPEKFILYMYDHPEYLDSHQLWPIFDVNIQTSNGLLWNDYDY